MTTLRWRCLDPTCDQSGLTTGTESGADVRHAKATGHGVTSRAREWEVGGDE